MPDEVERRRLEPLDERQLDADRGERPDDHELEPSAPDHSPVLRYCATRVTATTTTAMMTSQIAGGTPELDRSDSYVVGLDDGS